MTKHQNPTGFLPSEGRPNRKPARLGQMTPAQMAGAAQGTTPALKALANQTRLLILQQLLTGEKSVGQLHRVLDRPQLMISNNLAMLSQAGLIKARQDGTTVHCRLSAAPRPMIRQITSLLQIAPASFEAVS